MTMISIIETASRDAYPALIVGLEAEFGRNGIVEIATLFLEAELADFHWQSRIAERHLGAYESLDGDDIELDRIAIIGVLGGAWFTATCIIDGDGEVHSMRDLRLMKNACNAELAFVAAR